MKHRRGKTIHCGRKVVKTAREASCYFCGEMMQMKTDIPVPNSKQVEFDSAFRPKIPGCPDCKEQVHVLDVDDISPDLEAAIEQLKGSTDG